MSYIIVKTTQDDLLRIVPYIPDRCFRNSTVEEYLRKVALGVGFSVVFSPWGYPVACTNLGTFAVEDDAATFAKHHIPRPGILFGVPSDSPGLSDLCRESSRPLKYTLDSVCDPIPPRKCDRCGQKIDLVRNWSWFVPQIICPVCTAKEDGVRRKLREAGVEDTMQGCGYIPSVQRGIVGPAEEFLAAAGL